MTLIIGIKCTDGVVVGSDGAATFGAMGQHTVKQATKKLEILDSAVIVGVSGAIGLGQRILGEVQTLWQQKKLSGKKPHEAMTELRNVMVAHVSSEMQMAQLSKNVIGNAGIMGALCTTIIALPVSKEPCLFQFDQNCSPEKASSNLPFVAIGSGQTIADPFLAFIRRIFWKSSLPSIQEGVFSALWTLRHAIETNPGGISDPTQIAVLEKANGAWLAHELSKDEAQEHEEAISFAEKHLASFRESFAKGDGAVAVPPTT
jgi:20S proteasome alpha/beta subunit